MTILKFRSPHVRNISSSTEIDKDGYLQRILTVETDLRLHVQHPEHDRSAVDALLEELRSKMGEFYDRAVLKEISRDE